MKNYIIILSLLITSSLAAQVAIEKTTFRSTGSILEFNDIIEPDGVNRGIILPIVDAIDPDTEQGTLYLDATTDKIVYHSDSEVVDMTPAGPDLSSPAIAEVGEGTVINDTTTSLSSDSAPAVLKLSSVNKALLLPHVTNTDELVSPEPGTIVYEEASKSLVLFNGTKWSFWNK